MRRILRLWSDEPFEFPKKQAGVQYSPGPRFLRVRIPLAYLGARLETIAKRFPVGSSPEYLSELVYFIRNLRDNLEQGNGLYLYGDPGSGKSSAAAILCKAAVYHTPAVLFSSAEDVCRASIEDLEFDEDESLLGRMRAVDLLVIDDLGREHSKEYGKAQIEGLLRYRHDRLLSTIITTNIAVNKLSGVSVIDGEEKISDPTKYGTAMHSIINEKYRVIKVKGVAWREVARLKNSSGLDPRLMLSADEIKILRGETK